MHAGSLSVLLVAFCLHVPYSLCMYACAALSCTRCLNGIGCIAPVSSEVHPMISKAPSRSKCHARGSLSSEKTLTNHLSGGEFIMLSPCAAREVRTINRITSSSEKDQKHDGEMQVLTALRIIWSSLCILGTRR